MVEIMEMVEMVEMVGIVEMVRLSSYTFLIFFGQNSVMVMPAGNSSISSLFRS
ncbi:hypothetical protein F2Q68_00006953 [Brassica cretica]|uniref:Uncharacterized protein n=1 Tax=Brassica cretica TaxID=69181 RepID=A0A8S9J6I5_BRACR|nr:hypothetical protein F2Q68_00006953 [Brassica cretica]